MEYFIFYSVVEHPVTHSGERGLVSLKFTRKRRTNL